MRAFAAALGAAFFMAASQGLAAPASAKATANRLPCAAPLKDLIATAQAKGIRIEALAPAKVPGFLARLRKLFPNRSIMADEIIAARKPEGRSERGLVYLMLAKGGCVISAALVDRESFKMLNADTGL